MPTETTTDEDEFCACGDFLPCADCGTGDEQDDSDFEYWRDEKLREHADWYGDR